MSLANVTTYAEQRRVGNGQQLELTQGLERVRREPLDEIGADGKFSEERDVSEAVAGHML